MKRKFGIRGGLFCLAILLVLFGTAASAAANTSSDIGSLVNVRSVDYSPQIFYPYETGTITVHLANSDSSSIGLSQPDLISDDLKVLNQNSFQTLSYIGPGSTMDVSFVVTADSPDGIYFPLFTIGVKGGNAIHYPIKLQIDSTDLRASISNKPDNFAISRADTVNLSITNPRDGPIDNIIITTSGEGIDVSPSESFISTVNPGTSITLPFKVTPRQQGNLTFHVAFQNGDNKHSIDVPLVLNIGEDKTGANPVVNNVALTSQGLSYQLSGDINNAGITDAKSMVLTVASPAKAMEPYGQYAIGTLASDDFSSFQLTFASSNLSQVPLQIQWKDADGNSFSTIKNLDLRAVSAAGSLRSGAASSGSGTVGGAAAGGTAAGGSAAARGGGGGMALFGGRSAGGMSAFYPVIAGAVILIAGIVLYTKRKWIAGKLRKR